MELFDNTDTMEYLSLYIPLKEMKNIILTNKKTYVLYTNPGYWSYRGLMLYEQKIKSYTEYVEYYDKLSKDLCFMCKDYGNNVLKINKMIKMDINYSCSHVSESGSNSCESTLFSLILQNLCSSTDDKMCNVCEIICYMMKTNVLNERLENGKKINIVIAIVAIIVNYLNAFIQYCSDIDDINDFLQKHVEKEKDYMNYVIMTYGNSKLLNLLINKKIIFNKFYYFDEYPSLINAYYNPIFEAIETKNYEKLTMFAENKINLISVNDVPYNYNKIKKKINNKAIIDILKQSPYYYDFIVYLSEK